MRTRIYDTAAGIRVETGDTVRLINKSHIKDIAIVNGRICINTGAGVLQQLYINYPDVEEPGTHDMDELVIALQAMMHSRETNLSSQLDTVIAALAAIELSLHGTIDHFKEPQLIDDPFPGLSYKGYSSTLNADGSQPVWAILEIKQSGTLTSFRWADASKDFNKVWNDRSFYMY